MPPTSKGDAGGAALFRAEREVPCDIDELRGRVQRFLSTVGPALDSVEGVLESWNGFREVSAMAQGLPERSSFRNVQIDPFTIQQPPPTVTEAEITQYIKKLSKADLKALQNEYELSFVDGFDYMRTVEDGAEAATPVASRIVHFSSEAADATADCAAAAGAGDEAGDLTKQLHPVSASLTTRAKELFESEGTAVKPLTVKPDGRIAESCAAAPPAASSQIHAAFSLEQMTPSAVASHERRGSSSSASPYSGLRARPLATEDADANERYTVEIEYDANHFLPSVTQRALRDSAGSAIMIVPGTHHASKVDATNQAVESSMMAPPLQSDSDGEADKAGADIQSFTTFSRMVLADEGRRLMSQRAKTESSVSAGESQAASAVGYHEGQTLEGSAGTDVLPPQTQPALPTALTPRAAPASTVPVKVMNSTDSVSTRDAFVRKRVHDILLANRVRATDAAVLGAAFFEKLDIAWNGAANQTMPVLQKLDDMICEASALLQTLEVMNHQAYRDRVMDPAQFLCVPRYSATCAAPDCHAAFTTTVTRVMCGRCGQIFCPSCCAERGLGPDIVCDGQQYSLGWEPLCRLCFQMCRSSQRKVVEARHQHLRIEAVSSYHVPEAGDGGEDTARCASTESLTLKQAVLFGADCNEKRCLSDGLSPFYVMDRTENENVELWDVLRYQYAKTQGSLRRGWQSAGGMAARAMQSAAQIVKKRGQALR
ncbi:hypothetical protein ABL78_0766 [Leptomonas seymouri]|uniref:Uncharacterized protein n=1 Tax=Leptomonas seymouri TaxID=5684 RepID=A0A0N1I8B7_LEPSE|nr:hypothetical protein ABL78_0766 [Leptomonas seymouri]|eukprot:KPI90121.1 hypothetical protein ABL78_0766 [Leptomonas seymouri]